MINQTKAIQNIRGNVEAGIRKDLPNIHIISDALAGTSYEINFGERFTAIYWSLIQQQREDVR